MDAASVFNELDKKIDSVFKKIGENGRFVGNFSTKIRQFYIQSTLFLSDLSLIEAPLKAEQIFDVAIQSARSENIDLKTKMSKQGADLIKTELYNIDNYTENEAHQVMILTRKLEAAKSRKITSELEIKKLEEDNKKVQEKLNDIYNNTKITNSQENPILKEIQNLKNRIDTISDEITDISRNLYINSSQVGKECDLLEKGNQNLLQQLQIIERNIKYANYIKPAEIYEPIVPNHKIKSARIQKTRVSQIPARSPRMHIKNKFHMSVNKLSNLTDFEPRKISEPSTKSNLHFQRFTIVQRIPVQVYK